MAESIYDGTLFLTDFSYDESQVAIKTVISGERGSLGAFLGIAAEGVLNLYKGLVHVKTGQLQSKAYAYVEASGKLGRLIGKVVIPDDVVAPEPWHGAPFYYGVLHDEGAGQAKKGRLPGADDLYDALQMYAAAHGGVPK